MATVVTIMCVFVSVFLVRAKARSDHCADGGDGDADKSADNARALHVIRCSGSWV